jgi:thiol-disulfide isomerase/thioredoxin
VLVGVAAIALGLDSGLLTRVSLARTDSIEQTLLGKIRTPTNGAGPAAAVADKSAPGSLPVEGQLPALSGATSWLNSPPLTREGLRGKVVLIDFWTYSCINCLRSLPYVNGWYQKYEDHGLVVIGVHSPEFAFEKDVGNVQRAVHDLGVTYPVALDSNYEIWRAFDNQYWPAHYFIDAQGRIRGHHFGEGDYPESERILRVLLTEAGFHDLPPAGISAAAAKGVQAASDDADMLSPETYVGYARAEHFSSPSGVVPDQPTQYTAPDKLDINQWALTGTWTVDEEKGILNSARGSIVFRFQARDLHLVLGPGPSAKPVRFRVRMDGADPGASHGTDTDASGNGVVTDQRLYQLIRQTPGQLIRQTPGQLIRQPPGEIHRHTFTIEFLDAGVQAYAFTFG